MGKQIRFYQTKTDEEFMFDEFMCMGLVVYVSYNFFKTPKTLERVTKLVSYSDVRFSKDILFHISLPSLCNIQNSSISYTCTPNPAIEYMRCRKINALGGYVEYGRFWLDSLLYGNKELVFLYNKLVKYVKKNYVYCPKLSAYFGKDAYEKWKNKEINIRYDFDEFGH